MSQAAPDRAPAAEPGAATAPAPSRPAQQRSRPQWLSVEALFVPAALLVLLVVLSVATDTFLARGNLTNVATQMATLAIVAFGVTVVMIGGGFDLSVGSQVALHGSLAAIVMARTGSIPLGIATGLLSGLVFGLVNGLLVTQLAIDPFIATLGTLVTGRGIALAITGARPVAGLPEGLRGFGLDNPLGLPWIVWLMLACFGLASLVLHVTPWGLQVFAVGGNREAARLAGLRVQRVRIATFCIAGGFAAVAGLALTARLGSGQPTVGSSLELFAVAAVVLGGSSLYGGRGSMWRTLFGVALIAVIQNGLNLLNVSSPFQQVAIGVVFILAASSEFVRRVQARRSR